MSEGERKSTMQKSDLAGKESETGSLLVVNLRGLVNTKSQVRTTLEQLSLIKRFNATIVPDTKVYRGMLNLSKEHLAWCRVDPATVEKLLRTRAEVSDGRRFKDDDLSKAGYASFSQLASDVASGKTRLDGTRGLRRFFRLSPPRGGFKRSIRRSYGQGGVLGENKELIQLVEKML